MFCTWSVLRCRCGSSACSWLHLQKAKLKHLFFELRFGNYLPWFRVTEYLSQPEQFYSFCRSCLFQHKFDWFTPCIFTCLFRHSQPTLRKSKSCRGLFLQHFVHINSKSGIEVSLKPGQTHTHTDSFLSSQSRSRSSVGFLSGFAVDTVSAESYSLGLRDAQEQRLTRLLGVLVEEHSSLRPSIHRMCFCWREVKGKEKLFWRCICRWQWTSAWCLIGCQEVSNKELQKALRHMRKAEDQYYSSKGWPFGLNLSWEARFKTCVAVTCSHGSQALRFWSCDDRCQKNYDKYNMARQTAATQQCTNHDIISGYHTRKD